MTSTIDIDNCPHSSWRIELEMLTVVVITLNEEHNISRCLNSVAWADEIIVVDANSSDRTREIAKEHGARVLVREWQGFGKAKQAGVLESKGDWVLSLDADEVVSPALGQEIQAAIKSKDYVGYRVPRKTQFLGKWISHCGWYPDYVLRLFRAESGKVSADAVHERIEVDGQVGTLGNELQHYSYPTLEVYFSKFNRYTTLAARDGLRTGQRASVYDLLVRPFAAFIKHYFLRQGFRDGLQGFTISVLSSCYVFVKYSKIRELRKETVKSVASEVASEQTV